MGKCNTNLEKARKMRNVYKNSRKTWTEDTKQNGLRKKDLRNKIIANVIAHFAII